MKVLTIIEGRIPADKVEEFERSYAELSKIQTPAGLISSKLIRKKSDVLLYRVETLWKSQTAIDSMRKSVEVPAAIALFQKAGVKPTAEFFEVIQQIR